MTDSEKSQQLDKTRTLEQYQEKVIDALFENNPPIRREDIQLDTPLKKISDSAGLLFTMSTLEDEFSIDTDSDIWSNFRTPREIANYLHDPQAYKTEVKSRERRYGI